VKNRSKPPDAPQAVAQIRNCSLEIIGPDMREGLSDMKITVKDAMSKSVVACVSTESCQRAAELMRRHHVGAIPVVSDKNSRHLIGIVTDRDLAMKLVAMGRNAAVPVFNVMTMNPITCRANDPLDVCEEKMRLHRIRRVPVVDELGSCIGIVSQADVALHDDAQHLQSTVSTISRPEPVLAA